MNTLMFNKNIYPQSIRSFQIYNNKIGTLSNYEIKQTQNELEQNSLSYLVLTLMTMPILIIIRHVLFFIRNV